MLGWPKKSPEKSATDLLTTDVQSYHEINPIYRDDLSDIKMVKLTDRFIFTNKNTLQWDFIIKKTTDSSVAILFSLDDVTGYFNKSINYMKHHYNNYGKQNRKNTLKY